MPVPPTLVTSPHLPSQWSAPLPSAPTAPASAAASPETSDARTAALQAWWQSQHEPELSSLIEAAQALSPDIATALSRIQQAEAAQAQARATLLPSLSVTASSSRMNSPLYYGTYVQNQAGLQTNWELDLAALRGANSGSARAQLNSAQAQWHDARVAVAAEVAELYQQSRNCQAQRALATQDVASYTASAAWTQQSFQAGMASAITLAAAQSEAAQSRARLLQRQALCDTQLKALVALSGKDEPALRELLAPAWLRQAAPTPFAISAVPAQTLAQRPDIYMAEQAVLQAQAKVMQADAARLPRLSLEGFIGRGSFTYAGVSSNANTWTFGPLALSLPIFDAGRRAAEQSAALADMRAAMSTYQARVRQGVREVEEALVQLDSTEKRWQESLTTVQQSQISLQAKQAQLQQGMLSPSEFEEAQRQARSTQSAALDLDLERHRAWITLYRAVGGGFESAPASH